MWWAYNVYKSLSFYCLFDLLNPKTFGADQAWADETRLTFPGILHTHTEGMFLQNRKRRTSVLSETKVIEHCI